MIVVIILLIILVAVIAVMAVTEDANRRPESYEIKEYVHDDGEIWYALVHWLDGNDGTWWWGNYRIEARNKNRTVIENALQHKCYSLQTKGTL